MILWFVPAWNIVNLFIMHVFRQFSRSYFLYLRFSVDSLHQHRLHFGLLLNWNTFIILKLCCFGHNSVISQICVQYLVHRYHSSRPYLFLTSLLLHFPSCSIFKLKLEQIINKGFSHCFIVLFNYSILFWNDLLLLC